MGQAVGLRLPAVKLRPEAKMDERADREKVRPLHFRGMTQFDHALIDGSSAEKEDGRKQSPVFVGAVLLRRNEDLVAALLEHFPKSSGSCFALWRFGFRCVDSSKAEPDVFPPEVHAQIDVCDDGVAVDHSGNNCFVSVGLVHIQV